MNAELILRLRKASRSGSRMVAENLCAEAADYLESLAAQASQERQEPQILGMHAPTQGQIDSAKGLDVLLRKIADEVEILLASARALCDEEGTVKGYNISTGALHSIIGRLTGNGFAVEVPLLDAAPVPAPQEGWIRVNDRLPETWGYYLVALGAKYVHRSGYDECDGGWEIGKSVTHWMPLPAAPLPPTDKEGA